MNASDKFTQAFDDLIDQEWINTALQVVTGIFVGLTVAVCENAGHETNGEMRINGGDERDITIHAAKQAPRNDEFRTSAKGSGV